MFQLELKSRKSIYEQIVDNFKELILAGILKPDEKLPSVRELSKQLTVNPNTIQKAYRELEHQGYLYTSAGLGSFVAPPVDNQIDERLASELLDRIRGTVRELQYLGLPLDRIRTEISRIIEERNGIA